MSPGCAPDRPALRPHEAARLLGGPESFPDPRLWRRVPKLIDWFACRLRCPPAKQKRAAQRAANRWFANHRLCGASLVALVLKATADSCVGRALLVAAHDSSEIDEHGRGCPDDAGPLRSSNARGYLLHQAVVVTPEGRCLGAIEARAWTRDWELKKHDHRSRDMSDKESSKWDRSIEHTERRLRQAGFTGKVVHVEDREADIYEHLVNQKRKKRSLVVRHDLARSRMVLAPPARERGRKGGPGPPRWMALTLKLEAQPFRDSFEVEIDGRVRDRALGLTHEKRTAVVSYRYCAAVLKPPKLYRRKHFRDGLPVWLVEAREREPPPGAEPLHWILLCLDPVQSDEQARLTIRIYKARWKVEDFTKITKSGCQLEAAHVPDLASFKRLLAVVLASANQLLDIVAAAREAPAGPAREVVGDQSLGEVREACGYHKVAWPRGRVTTGGLLRCVAQVGGYEPRADRAPGWLVLCRGWALVAEHTATIEYHESHRQARLRARRKRRRRRR